MYAGLIDELGLTPSGNIGKAVDVPGKGVVSQTLYISMMTQ
ncbi:75_t:CDS:2 [Entrophospora sp. SA101]|nr:75_t:CDS:2 [Entrophospora sp. SA101]CAJ0851467.1 7255_t:CDS:2 [Entrophospora sp. SA101]